MHVVYDMMPELFCVVEFANSMGMLPGRGTASCAVLPVNIA